MTNLKYAYPKGNQLILSEEKQEVRPAGEEEIEIESIEGDILKGYLVHFGNDFIIPLEVNEVREEDLEFKKIGGFLGKKRKVIKKGWVRLKKVTRVELDLRNRIITKVFQTMERKEKLR